MTASLVRARWARCCVGDGRGDPLAALDMLRELEVLREAATVCGEEGVGGVVSGGGGTEVVCENASASPER